MVSPSGATVPNDLIEKEERQRRWLLDEWRVAVHPIDDSRRAAAQAAVEFAQTLLKTAAILNGGALILLPAYFALAREAIDDARHQMIVGAVIAFVIGLLFAWLSAACAYFTMVLQTEALRQFREANAKRLLARFGSLEVREIPELSARRWGEGTKSAEEHERAEKKKWNVAERFRWSGIFFNFASFSSFVVGCWIGIGVIN